MQPVKNQHRNTQPTLLHGVKIELLKDLTCIDISWSEATNLAIVCGNKTLPRNPQVHYIEHHEDA